mmetsp:Transcript_48101/g.73236  ORF Transcript_48101/g.73236 Transcript_48101/m.73236 type:complete len:419 (-) Transcript_48101:61-1317(-)
MWKTFSKALFGGVASSVVLFTSVTSFHASTTENYNDNPISSNFQHFNRCQVDKNYSVPRSREELQKLFLLDQEIWSKEGMAAVPTKHADSVRVMSWNVHMCYDINSNDSHEEIINVINKISPDIISLQEIRSENHENYSSPSSCPFPSQELISGDLIKNSEDFSSWQQEKLVHSLTKAGYPHFIARLGSHNGKNINLGNAIFSRFPFAFFASCDLPTVNENDEIRTVVEGLFRISSTKPENVTPLHVVCTHLDVWDESGFTRAIQIEHLIELMKSRNDTSKGCQILMGDFNSVSWDVCKQLSDEKMKFIEMENANRGVFCFHHPMDILLSDFDEGKSDMVDVFVQNRKISLVTSVDGKNILPLRPLCSTVWSGRTIDYILLNRRIMTATAGGWKVVGVYCLATKASDHVPLVIDLQKC